MEHLLGKNQLSRKRKKYNLYATNCEILIPESTIRSREKDMKVSEYYIKFDKENIQMYLEIMRNSNFLNNNVFRLSVETL